jgi:hypothetical protein
MHYWIQVGGAFEEHCTRLFGRASKLLSQEALFFSTAVSPKPPMKAFFQRKPFKQRIQTFRAVIPAGTAIFSHRCRIVST